MKNRSPPLAAMRCAVARGLAQRQQNPRPQPVKGQMTGYEGQGRGPDGSPLVVVDADSVMATPVLGSTTVPGSTQSSVQSPVSKGM